ncbi:hypothetical protein K8R42_02585 [bacterium]|nr:hypothetical protein [bacterium]
MRSINNKGISLIGLIIVVLIIAVLATAIFLWINPVEIIGDAKDKKRTQDVALIARAIAEYTNDHGGALPILGNVSTTKQVLCASQSGSSLSCDGDSNSCVRIAHSDFYNNYMPELPIDPDKAADTDTGYYLEKDERGQLVVGACSTYGSDTVSTTPGILVSCDAYAGGYCWYLATGEDQDCDTTCAEYSLDCVTNITYGPDLDSGASCYAALGRAFGGTCGSECDETSSNFPPDIAADFSECHYQNSVFNCSQAPGLGYFSICPCQ